MDKYIIAGAFIAIVGLALIVFITLLLCYIKDEAIPELICWYKRKHRFDKPPTAKCYCRDCKRWNERTGECSDNCNSRYMADNWFCCFVEPLCPASSKKRDKAIKEALNEEVIDE